MLATFLPPTISSRPSPTTSLSCIRRKTQRDLVQRRRGGIRGSRPPPAAGGPGRRAEIPFHWASTSSCTRDAPAGGVAQQREAGQGERVVADDECRGEDLLARREDHLHPRLRRRRSSARMRTRSARAGEARRERRKRNRAGFIGSSAKPPRPRRHRRVQKVAAGRIVEEEGELIMAEIPLEAEAPAAPAPAEPIAAVPAAPSRRPLVKRHHGIVRLAHWANAVLLLGMIASGLQIYTRLHAFRPARRALLPEPVGRQALPRLGAARRLAGRRAQLALRPRLAVRAHRPGLPGLPRGLGGVALAALPAARRAPGLADAALLPAPAQGAPAAGQAQRPPEGRPTRSSCCSARCRCSTGFAVYKPVQLCWLTALFGGYELARYWHFWAVWIFVAFILVHVALVFLVDPASLRAMITGWYRGRFPSHD